MEETDIRIGQTLHVLTGDDLVTGKVESGHAGQWMIRTAQGELTGPWDTEDLHSVLYVATINVPGYVPVDDDPPVFETARAAWLYLADERVREEDMVPDDVGEYSSTVEALRYLASDDHVPGSPHEDWPTAADGTGTVYGDTVGYQGSHDLGLAYSVNIYQG